MGARNPVPTSEVNAELDAKRISAVKSVIPLLWLGLFCGLLMLWLAYPVLSWAMIAAFAAGIASLIGTLIYAHKKARGLASRR